MLLSTAALIVSLYYICGAAKVVSKPGIAEPAEFCSVVGAPGYSDEVVRYAIQPPK